MFPSPGYDVELYVGVGGQWLHLSVLGLAQGNCVMDVVAPGELVVDRDSQVLKALYFFPNLLFRPRDAWSVGA